MPLQSRKNLQQQIVGTTRFSAHTIPITDGPGQPDLIHHQLQLEHLLIQTFGLGSAREAVTHQQGQPPTL